VANWLPSVLLGHVSVKSVFEMTYNALSGTLTSYLFTPGDNDSVLSIPGGEASLQAAASSVFGFGSDSGGSIRMPASFNGIYGHKATAGPWVCLSVL